MAIFQPSPCQFTPGGYNSHPVNALGDAGNGHAREMGCLRLRSKRRVGPSDLDFVMPKVKEVRGAVKGGGRCIKKSCSNLRGNYLCIYIYIFI